MEPEVVADYSDHLGENPLWHAAERQVYWEDYTRGRLLRFNPESNAHEVLYEGKKIGGFTIQSDGSLLLFMEKGTIARLSQGELSYIVKEIPNEDQSHFNDVVADPKGRVFCGTVPDSEPDRNNWSGRLYRLDTDGSITIVLEGIGCSNGMGFTQDRKGMYYTDSLARSIYLFDYNILDGGLSNKRIFVKIPAGDGMPDGMTVDAEGYVWSARWGASCLVRYRPDGTEQQRFHFPAEKVSSITFGGSTYTDMYVTSAGGDNRPADGEHAGALFRLKLGIQGLPEFQSQIFT